MNQPVEANLFTSEAFADQLRQVELGDTLETVLDNGNRDFTQLSKVFDGVSRIAVIGWSSQGPAQARNIRDSVTAAGLDTEVVIGLRGGRPSRAAARAHDFHIMEPENAIQTSEMSLMLISDAAQVEKGRRLMELAPEGSNIGFSHGFLAGYYERTGQEFPDHVDITGVCPKGMGPSVRRLYEQGSGINSSFAVEQGDAAARDRTLGWAVALGSPFVFQTTLGKEWRSDVFGERAMLLGGVHGTVEAFYNWKREVDMSPEQAYTEVVESVVGPISEAISHDGLAGLFERLNPAEQEQFIESYNATYPALKNLTQKIYANVSSGLELEEVVSDNRNDFPMTRVDGTDMWRAGERVRAGLAEDPSRRAAIKIDPQVAGAYVAGMMAQVDVLRDNDHAWSEVVNESIIEAVDSLNPYMRKNGVAYMVDNCSITARRGSRKWAPHYQAWIQQEVLPVIDGSRGAEDKHDYFGDFLNHDVHQALSVLSEMRPKIDIAVQ